MVYKGPLCNNAFVENYFAGQARQGLSLPSAMILRKDALVELGGFDESIKKYGEDLDMWFRIGLRYPQIGYSRKVTVLYWTRAGSIMAMDTSPSSARLQGFIKRIEQIAAEAGAGPAALSEPLIRTWVRTLARRAMKESDRKMLRQVCREYRRRLDLKTWLLIFVSRLIPSRVFRMGLAVRARLRRLWRQ